MAAYRVLDTYEVADSRTLRGYAYTAVPAGSNDAGIPWQSVASEFQTAKSSRRPTVDPPNGITRQQVNDGEFLEWDWHLNVSASLTPAQLVAAIESFVAAEETRRVGGLRTRLRYWGFSGST